MYTSRPTVTLHAYQTGHLYWTVSELYKTGKIIWYGLKHCDYSVCVDIYIYIYVCVCMNNKKYVIVNILLSMLVHWLG